MKSIAVGSNGETPRVIELLEHEFESLLQALRRDMRREKEYSEAYHGCNARMDIRLLEVLQPKTNPALPVVPPAAVPDGALLSAAMVEILTKEFGGGVLSADVV